MNPLLLAALAVGFVGCALVLAEFRWFSRVSLSERLRPYSTGPMTKATTSVGLLSVESFREVVGPLSRAIGDRIAGLFGVGEELSTRLERIHSPLDVAEFRVRQLGWSATAGLAGTLAAFALRPPAPIGLLFIVGSPTLVFLYAEQRLASSSTRWQRRIFLELPVVSEQLAMLLSTGYSLNSALGRIAARGSGACSVDLARAMRRTRQGLSDIEALREWATIADVGALDRLVSVLGLNYEAADLGALIAEESRAVRRDVYRELMERIEKRTQQVWIPVTVAALVPGVILMAIPFIDALSLFAAP